MTTDAAEAEVLLYCDGACSPNPGCGGWAAILIHPATGTEKEIFGAEPDTTNNRMELRAALEGLRALKGPRRVRLITDSQYLKKAFTDGWLEKWQRNGWRTSTKEPVKNEDLWRALVEQINLHTVDWAWVRGHATDVYNNRCDELAVDARKRFARASAR